MNNEIFLTINNHIETNKQKFQTRSIMKIQRKFVYDNFPVTEFNCVFNPNRVSGIGFFRLSNIQLSQHNSTQYLN